MVSAGERRACEKDRKSNREERRAEGRKEEREARKRNDGGSKGLNAVKAIVKRVSCGRISF